MAYLQVILSSEAAAHAAAARAAVHEVVEKGEKEAAEAAALPQLEHMRSAAGLTGRLSPSRASAGVQEPRYAPAAGTAAAKTQGLAVVDLPVLPEGAHGQPPGAADFLWDAEPAAGQGEVPGAVSGLQPDSASSQVAGGHAAPQHAQQPGSPALQHPHSQAPQGPGSTPVLVAASTAGRGARPTDAHSAESEHMPAAVEAAAHSPFRTDSVPAPLAVTSSHAEEASLRSTAAQGAVELQRHEGAADLAAAGDPAADPAAAYTSVGPSSSRRLMLDTPQSQADTGSEAAASGWGDWGEDISAGAQAPEPASGWSHEPAVAAGASPVPEAPSSAASVPAAGASHIPAAAGASDRQAALPNPGSAAEAGLPHHASAFRGSKSPASSDHSWGTDALPADAPEEDQLPSVAGSLGDAEVEPAHSEAAAKPSAATGSCLPAPDRAGSSRTAADEAAQLAGHLGEDATAAAEAPATAAGPSPTAAGQAEAAAEPSALAGGSLLAPQAAGGSPTAAQDSLAFQLDDYEEGENAFASAEAPETIAQPGVSPDAADNLTAQQAATSGEGDEPSEGSGGFAPCTAASSGFESPPEDDTNDKIAAADGAAERKAVPAEQAAEDEWAADDFVAGGVLSEHDWAAAELLPGPPTPGEAVPAAGSTAQSPRAAAVSEIEPAGAEEQEDWGDDDGFGDFNDAADASALEQEAGDPHAGPLLQHPLPKCMPCCQPAEHRHGSHKLPTGLHLTWLSDRCAERSRWIMSWGCHGLILVHATMHKSSPPDPVGPAASARPPSPHPPAAPAQQASSAAHPAAAGGAVDLLSLRGPDYQAAVRQLLQPLTAAHQTPAPEAWNSQQGGGCEGSDALGHQQTSEESEAQGGAGGGQAGWGGGHRAARPLQELLQQHAGLGLLGAALRRAGLLEGPALTAQQSAEVRDRDSDWGV